MLSEQLLMRLREEIGSSNVLVEPADTVRYLVDARRRYQGQALCVARPGSTEQVAAVVKACADGGVALVPQGGNTGMCGGATPVGLGPGAVVLSLERMARIREIDAANNTLTVDAGCTLAAAQAAAAAADRLFPMSLGSEGSCQVGGNIATNAGGTAVLRYGNMRDLVLGLEVVMPDGRVWNGLRRLRKDNTGYDLKQVMIGSEGTLGVITGAVLKLFSRPAESCTALASLDSIHQVLELLGALRKSFGEHITTFEAMSRNEYDLVFATHKDRQDPLEKRCDWYAFIEVTHARAGSGLRETLEDALADAMKSGLVNDAAIAASMAQADNIWHIRHGVTEANLRAGAAISHDTSVPVSMVPQFVEASEAEIKRSFPDARVLFVGHVGDGNIHVIAIFPREKVPDAKSFTTVAGQVNAIVDRVTVGLGGSISAEHGIGRSNRERLREHKDPIELQFMLQLKAALDPRNIMNPGALL